MDDAAIRPIDLVSVPVLDERAVQEFPRAMRTAVGAATEILGGITRRESDVSISDILDPINRSEVDDLVGPRFSLRTAGHVAGALHLTEADAIALADLFLGGPGRGEERAITEIELRVICRSMAQVITPLVGTATFSRVDLLDAVADSDLAGLAEHLVRATLTITVGEESIEAGLYVQDPDRSGPVGSSTEPVVTSSAATMPIELDIELAAVDMPAADIGSLAAGDVVVFDVRTDAPATALHAAKPLFDGLIRHEDDRRLFEVTSVHSA